MSSRRFGAMGVRGSSVKTALAQFSTGTFSASSVTETRMDIEILGRTPAGFERRLADSVACGKPDVYSSFHVIKVEPTRRGHRLLIDIKKLPKELSTLVVSWDE